MNIRRLTRTPDSYCSSHPGDRKEPGVTRACQSEPWGGDGIDARPDWFRRPCRGSTNSSPRTPGSLRSPGATVRGPSGAGLDGNQVAAPVHGPLMPLFRLPPHVSPPSLRGRVGWQSGRGADPWASHAVISLASARLSAAPPVAGLDRKREPGNCACRLPPGGGPENSPG
jgi:hypothetical protein